MNMAIDPFESITNPELREYLRQEMLRRERMQSPEMLAMQSQQRGADFQTKQNLQDLSGYAGALTQLGSLGGKTTSAAPVQQAVQGQLGLLEQQKQQQAMEAAQMDKSRGMNLEVSKYLQAQQDRKAEMAQKRNDLLEQRRVRAGERAEDRKFKEDMFDKEADLKLRTKTPDAKEIASDREANYRYITLQNNADQLKELINKKGTFEMTGSAGTEMDSKIYQMAVDFAKLVDPESVAREGEVAAAQKYMLPVREWGGLMTSNKTAGEMIDKYKQDLDARLAARRAAKTGDLQAKTFPQGKVEEKPLSIEAEAQAAPVIPQGRVKVRDKASGQVGHISPESLQRNKEKYEVVP